MNIILPPQPGHWALAVLPRHQQREQLLACIAQLALDGPVMVLDGGMLFNSYRVLMAAHGQTRILGRIRFARAFTCYQMVALLERTPAEESCIFVLDLLATFHDENVPSRERTRLLEICIPHLDRLSRARGGLVGVGLPETMAPESQPLFHLLAEKAARIHKWQPSALPEKAAPLF